jgi:hypothetical protein
MTGSFTVVFDSCVLYSAPLRDLLMQLALSDLFRARWTNQIHEEWISNLLDKRPDLSRAKLEETRKLMDAYSRDSLVSGYERLIDQIKGCPDQNDRHVIAAAYHCGADAIVTHNLKDFPSAVLAPYGLEAIHPDDFIRYQLDLSLAKVIDSVRTCRARLKNPPKSAESYLDTLEAQALPKTVSALRNYLVMI